MVSKKYLNSKLLGELSHYYFKNKLMWKSEYMNVKVSQITAASKREMKLNGIGIVCSNKVSGPR